MPHKNIAYTPEPGPVKYAVGDTYYQAHLSFFGRSADRDFALRKTEAEAEQDLADEIAWLSEREQASAKASQGTYVARYRVIALDPDGSVGFAARC